MLLNHSWIGLVAPDPCSHVTTTGREAATAWAGCHANDRVLVALQHELCVAGSWVPELDTTILGARKDPGSIRSERNRENEVL
jgi:hypothetical protein